MRFRTLNRLETLVRRVEAGEIDSEAAQAAIRRQSVRIAFTDDLARQAADFVRRQLAAADQATER